ncbi:TROVE domain-containing protein [Tellurirhabdus rosea]|uniref:TROVE domain-containing protein n=1 Tax=Tellurirhabdus rosea TaxID=2674997 RepID=UPI00225B852B|nr:TROVE domain-containing protein [Tellurirhabdus rosea]
MKFNLFTSKKSETVNYEGAKAYVLTPELELYSAVATTMLADSFYEKADDRLNRIRTLVGKVSPAFVAKLAVYVREQLYLRSAPVVLTGELAKRHNGDSLVSRTVARVVQRPDEITELLAYYQLTNERKGAKKLGGLSKQVQKGLGAAFNRFDEYQFAKYNRDAQVKLRDALFLVHPKAKDEAQQAIYNKIVTDTLETPYTWETELSALGQQTFASEKEKQAAFRAKWEDLVASRRLGYMATLRNLRNMLEAGVGPATMQRVCDFLSDAEAVRRSKQLPFRFLAAYREIRDIKSGYVAMIQDALEDALRYSVANLRGFSADTRVVIACDVSGSMQQPVSAKSKVLLYDIGLLLGMLLQAKCRNVVCGMFGDRWKTVQLPGRNVLANVQEFYRREGEVGYSTNGYLVIDDLIRRKYVADKIMLFTDTQLWDSYTNNAFQANTLRAKWAAYKQLAPSARLYLFDLAGYGQAPLRVEANDVYLLAGWSDKVFDVLQALEDGEISLAKIEAITL